MSPKAPAGFTLAELLMAMALFGLMMAAMAGIQAMASRTQAQQVSDTLVEGAATLAREAVGRALAGASCVSTPSAGAASDKLTAWENVDPENGSSPLVPGEDRAFSHLCMDGGSSLHLYSGGYPMPLIACGAEVSGVEHVLVAGGANLAVSARFYRPPDSANVVLVDYTVETAGAAPIGRPARVTHRAQFTLQHAK